MKQNQFEALLPQIVQLAENNAAIDALYLYGSHAQGTANENSDIDLAVIFSNTEADALKRRLRPELLAIDWMQTLKLPEGSLSILDMEAGPVPLAMSVLKTGKLIVNKDPGHDLEVSGLRCARRRMTVVYIGCR